MNRVANRLRTTFVPGEDPDGSERRVVADQPIVIYKPKQRQKKVAGLTFMVTAANMPLSKYTSIITALNSVDHVVVGFFVNVLKPARGNHRAKAEKIAHIFQEIKGEFNVKKFDIVGHSIGGKIALLAAALYDEEGLIRNVVSLDPVDQNPVEFTNELLSKKDLLASSSVNGGDTPPPNPFKDGGEDDASEAASTVTKGRRGRRTNLSLESSNADITLTFTDTGYWIGKTHNARQIQKYNPSVKLVMHRNSCHMVYCDDDGLLSWKALMGRGKSADRNQIVRDETATLIKERAMRSTISGHASGKMKSTIGKAKQAMESGISDLKELRDDAQKKSSALAGAATLSKVVG